MVFFFTSESWRRKLCPNEKSSRTKDNDSIFNLFPRKSNMVVAKTLVRRLRGRKVWDYDGELRTEYNDDQATKINLSVHDRHRNKRAPQRNVAAPVRIFEGNKTRRQRLRNVVNQRAARALKSGRVHISIDLISSVPRPRKIKNKAQLRKWKRNIKHRV